ASSGERELERCGGVLRVAEQEGRCDIPAAERGRMGIRLPGGDDDEVFVWRRSEGPGGGGGHRWDGDGAGWPLQPEPLGPVRRAREGLGVVLGLVRRRLLQTFAAGRPAGG